MNKNDYIEKLNYELEQKTIENKVLKDRLESIEYSRSWKLRGLISKAFRVLTHPSMISRKIANNKREKWEHSEDLSQYIHTISEYQEDIDYSGYKTDIKAIAFYLPQFHEFKENNEWWGKGFTEWTNTRKSEPRFEGHYQPREPHDDIGYYDLSDVNVLKKQAELAKRHGIYGFCFYYYWFSGKRLMEKPVDQLLEHPEIDLPFCLCWANENWTRTWDGLEKSVLIGQEYSEKDPVNFIKDIKKYVEDKRYIKIDGKPVIILYNPSQVPDVDNVILKWKETAIEEGIGEIYVITRNLIREEQLDLKNNDAEYDFVPLQKGFDSAKLLIDENGNVFDYGKTVDEMINLYKDHHPDKQFYYTSMMEWDNSARRATGYNIFTRYRLEDFYRWNRAIINKIREENSGEKIMFVNAWNEWCEGTYLDPDKKYGYANINTLSKALFDLPFKPIEVINSDEKLNKNFNKRIAVQIHLFHTDLVDEIIEQLNNVPYKYDVYISTDSEEKKELIEKGFKAKCKANKVFVEVTQNIGRDVAPFLYQMNKVYKDYDYICHIHSKKSSTTEYGDSWRTYTYNNLFGSEENVIGIFRIFENNDNVGMIFPHNYPVVSDQTLEYGENFEQCRNEFIRLGMGDQIMHEKLEFAAGTMFWARVEAIKPIFEANHTFDEFPPEAGQLDATIAHAIERTFVNLCKTRGYKYVNTFNNTLTHKSDKKKRITFYADVRNEFDENDIDYVNELCKYSEKVVLLSSSNDDKLKKVKDLFDDVKVCDYFLDIEYWISGLKETKDINSYDEVVLTSNDCRFTYIPMSDFFANINNGDVRVLNNHNARLDNKIDYNYVNKDLIVLTKDVVNNKIFIRKLKNVVSYKKMFDLNHEAAKKFRRILDELNINIESFISEAEYINKYASITRMEICNPLFMILLGSPVVKKNSNLFVEDEQQVLVEDMINRIKKGYNK